MASNLIRLPARIMFQSSAPHVSFFNSFVGHSCSSFVSSIYTTSRLSLSSLLSTHQTVHQLRVSRIHTSSSYRQTDGDPEYQLKPELPCLMNHPTHIVWPSLFKSISNLLSSTLIIRPYFDNEFSLTEFNRGAKHALGVISNALAVGDTDSLQDLVDSQTLVEIKQNMSRYSSQQLSELAVRNPDDVYLMFPYQVGMIMNDTDKGIQERFVEITMCFHIFEGLSELMEKEGFRPNPSSMQKHREKIVIGNYRFLREFTKGVQGDWQVNRIHHFRLVSDGPMS